MSDSPSADRACWSWRSDTNAWFAMLGRAAEVWEPDPRLGLSVDALADRLQSAAAGGERWLIHPVLSSLADVARPASLVSDARLATWVAAHGPASGGDDGAITLEAPTRVWGLSGPVDLDPGRHDLDELCRGMGEPPSFAVPDPWGDSFEHRAELGDLVDHAWWNKSDEEIDEGLVPDLQALLRTQHALSAVLPGPASWLRSVTSVVVPLASPPSPAFRSGTMAELPGVVFVEVTPHHLLTLEAMIHESAHLHFHMEQMGAPFFVNDDVRLYSSPLRVDPRPLRGIFLAYHALAHMVAFYEDWLAATGDERCAEALPALVEGRDDAESTLWEAASTGLTDAGRGFLQTCSTLMTDGVPA